MVLERLVGIMKGLLLCGEQFVLVKDLKHESNSVFILVKNIQLSSILF